MSVLKLKCYDQVLSILTTPVIASGVKEFNEVEVQFNDSWNEFGKTAVFYRDDTKVYHVVMVENKCVIPHEVLENDGVLYFGLFGVHGNKRITTNVLRYKIVKGAILEGQEPKPPTPDIYEQILSVYGQILAKYESIFKDIDKIVADAVLQGVVNQNRPNELCKMWLGTKEEFNKITNKNPSTIYYVTDENESVFYQLNGEISDGKKITLVNNSGDTLYPKTIIDNVYDHNGNLWEGSTLKVKTYSMRFKNGVAKQPDSIDNILCLRKFGDSPSSQITENIYSFSTKYTEDSTTEFEIRITDPNYSNYNGSLIIIYLAA